MSQGPTRHNDDDAFEQLKRRRADESASARLFQLSGVGFEFIASVGGFAAVGWYLDRRGGSSPRYTLLGLAIGFALGLYRLVRFGLRMNRS